MKLVNKHLFKLRRILVSVKEIIAFIKQHEHFGKRLENSRLYSTRSWDRVWLKPGFFQTYFATALVAL